MNAQDLGEVDRDRITKYLSAPLDFPQEFKNWILDQVAMNIPPIPVEQLLGYVKTRAYGNAVTGPVSTSSSSYVDLGGPVLSGLPDGEYLVMWGCKVGTTYGRMALSENGGGASDNDSVYIETGGSLSYTGVRLKGVTLAAGGAGNSLLTVFRKDSSGGPGSASFSLLWLVAVRMA